MMPCLSSHVVGHRSFSITLLRPESAAQQTAFYLIRLTIQTKQKYKTNKHEIEKEGKKKMEP